jgi:pyridoxamine 5'-phosphate oxidase family protein
VSPGELGASSSSFSEPEVQYLKSQRLARIATATVQGKPDVSPVAFEFDGTYFLLAAIVRIFSFQPENTRMSEMEINRSLFQ